MVSTTAMGRLRMKSPAPSGHEDDRQEGHDEDGGAAEHGERDLTAWLDRPRRGAFVAVAQEALDVLHDHDAVVHQQAEGDDHAHDTELVDGEAEEVEQEESDGDGERDGDHHHRRGAGAERQQGDEHEQDGDAGSRG